MAAGDIPLSAELSDRFRRFIADRSGLYFRDHDVKVLEDAVRKRAASCGLGSGDAYLLYLMSRAGREHELKELLNLLTVGHTYFFRNGAHFQALREKVLPEVVERKRHGRRGEPGTPELRIWSAGCSTGEEAYSIAMSVLDVVEDASEWNIRIRATDISAGALDAARRGRYSGNAIRRVGAGHLERYFEEGPEGDGCRRVKDRVRALVQFDYLNIWESPYPTGLDIIFCRNVLIYFKPDSILGVINRLHGSLLAGGYLFMGGSESPQFFTDRFEMRTWGDAVCYRKVDRADRGRTKERAVPRRGTAAGSRIAPVPSRERPGSEIESRGGNGTEGAPGVAGRMEEIRACIQAEDYARARLLVDEVLEADPVSAEANCLAAEVDTRQGRLREADARLERILRLDPFFAPAHCLLGLVSFEEGDREKAKKRLRKALFLDGNFPMAWFLLGIIHEEEGRWEEAVREYGNTVEILGDGARRGTVFFGGGFNAEALSEISRAGIERLRSRR